MKLLGKYHKLRVISALSQSNCITVTPVLRKLSRSVNSRQLSSSVMILPSNFSGCIFPELIHSSIPGYWCACIPWLPINCSSLAITSPSNNAGGLPQGLAVTFGHRLNGFDAPRFRSLPTPQAADMTALTDVNADGLPDLVMTYGLDPGWRDENVQSTRASSVFH